MSHFPTAHLPQDLPKATAHFMHTILPPHEIQILFSNCSSPLVISIDSYITLWLSEVFALQRFCLS